MRIWRAILSLLLGVGYSLSGAAIDAPGWCAVFTVLALGFVLVAANEVRLGLL